MIEFIAGVITTLIVYKKWDFIKNVKFERNIYEIIKPIFQYKKIIVKISEDKYAIVRTSYFNNFCYYDFVCREWESSDYRASSLFEKNCTRSLDICRQILNPTFDTVLI